MKNVIFISNHVNGRLFDYLIDGELLKTRKISVRYFEDDAGNGVEILLPEVGDLQQVIVIKEKDLRYLLANPQVAVESDDKN